MFGYTDFGMRPSNFRVGIEEAKRKAQTQKELDETASQYSWFGGDDDSGGLPGFDGPVEASIWGEQDDLQPFDTSKAQVKMKGEIGAEFKKSMSKTGAVKPATSTAKPSASTGQSTKPGAYTQSKNPANMTVDEMLRANADAKRKGLPLPYLPGAFEAKSQQSAPKAPVNVKNSQSTQPVVYSESKDPTNMSREEMEAANDEAMSKGLPIPYLPGAFERHGAAASGPAQGGAKQPDSVSMGQIQGERYKTKTDLEEETTEKTPFEDRKASEAIRQQIYQLQQQLMNAPEGPGDGKVPDSQMAALGALSLLFGNRLAPDMMSGLQHGNETLAQNEYKKRVEQYDRMGQKAKVLGSMWDLERDREDEAATRKQFEANKGVRDRNKAVGLQNAEGEKAWFAKREENLLKALSEGKFVTSSAYPEFNDATAEERLKFAYKARSEGDPEFAGLSDKAIEAWGRKVNPKAASAKKAKDVETQRNDLYASMANHGSEYGWEATTKGIDHAMFIPDSTRAKIYAAAMTEVERYRQAMVDNPAKVTPQDRVAFQKKLQSAKAILQSVHGQYKADPAYTKDLLTQFNLLDGYSKQFGSQAKPKSNKQKGRRYTR